MLIKKEARGIEFYTRIGTSDSKSFKEVVEDKGYERGYFQILEGERWLDLGCNVGAFSCLVLSLGATVTSYEPEPNNAKLARENIKRNGYKASVNEFAVVSDGYDEEFMKFYLSNTAHGQWRHSLYKSKNKKYINVPVKRFSDVIGNHNCVKMDIEGAEIDILQSVRDWGGVTKFCMEYHFDVNNSIPLFLQTMDTLKGNFNNVKHGKMPEGKLTYDFFPPAQIVFAWN